MTMEVIAGIILIVLFFYVGAVGVYASIKLDRDYKEELSRLQKEIERIKNGDKEEKNE